MKHYFTIDKEQFSVEFYNESAHVVQIKENQEMGFFMAYRYFDEPKQWFWYPPKAAAYVKKLYKNRMFL